MLFGGRDEGVVPGVEGSKLVRVIHQDRRTLDEGDRGVVVRVRRLEGRQHAAVARQSAVACRQSCVLWQTPRAASVERGHSGGSAEHQQREEGEEGRAGACISAGMIRP